MLALKEKREAFAARQEHGWHNEYYAGTLSGEHDVQGYI